MFGHVNWYFWHTTAKDWNNWLETIFYLVKILVLTTTVYSHTVSFSPHLFAFLSPFPRSLCALCGVCECLGLLLWCSVLTVSWIWAVFSSLLFPSANLLQLQHFPSSPALSRSPAHRLCSCVSVNTPPASFLMCFFPSLLF